jgi:hypothetical protein
MNRVATVHHTTDKVFDITCELGRDLDLVTYAYRGVEALMGNTPITLFNTKTKVLTRTLHLFSSPYCQKYF